MRRRDFLSMSSAGLTAAVVPGLIAPARRIRQARAFTFEPSALGKTLKTPAGKTVFEYVVRKPADSDMTANSVCCFHPLTSPSGERLTVFGAGHRHYRGVFFGWHTVEFHELVPAAAAPAGRGGGGGGARGGGQRPGGAAPPEMSPEVLARQNQPTRSNTMVGDYWGWGRYAVMEDRVIKSRSVELVSADATRAQLTMQNDWTVRGQVLMEESLTSVVREAQGVYLIDLAYTFAPKGVDVVLPTWSFGGFCVSGRSDAESAYYESPEGKVDRGNPSMVDGETSWPDADWYSRTHVLAGKTAGYAVVNHPSNPKTRWWNPPSTGNINPSIVTYGDFKIPNGQPLTLKYRVVAFDGALPAARMNELSADFRKA